MTVSREGTIVTIEGNIKSVSDFKEIKSVIDSLTEQHKSVSIFIVDSFSITSSVIGYFNKLVLKDEVVLSMRVNDDRLYELLNDLNLISLFHVTKV